MGSSGDVRPPLSIRRTSSQECKPWTDSAAKNVYGRVVKMDGGLRYSTRTSASTLKRPPSMGATALPRA